MKKTLFALAIMPLLIVACSSDDDNSSKTDFVHNIELLYGQWRATGVEVGGVTIDLTAPRNELMVAPTYLTFGKDGSYISEGFLGEGTGKFVAKDKSIITSIGKHKVGYEMTSLSARTARVKVDAKALGLSIIPEGTQTVLVELTKDYESKIDFDHDIELLYGEWRATSLEGTSEGSIDLTHPAVKPTYITFEKKGVYTSKGLLGNGTGRFVTKDKKILTLLNDKTFDFEMSSLNESTAEIELNAKEIDFGMPLPEDAKMVTVVLTKQKKK